MGTHKDAEYGTAVKKRRFVEEELSKREAQARYEDPESETYLDGIYGARRQQAILQTLDRALTDFAPYGLNSIVEAFTKYELIPYNNYNQLDRDYDICIGAALWILDTIRFAGKMGEVYRILPDVLWDMEDFVLPTDFYHPCYEYSLIQSVIYVLSHRYPAGAKGDHIINRENARKRRPDETYTKLIALLPQEKVKAACDSFRQKQWEILSLFLQGEAYYDRERKRILDRADSIYKLAAGPLANPAKHSPIMGGGEFIPDESSRGADEGAEIRSRLLDLIDRQTRFPDLFDGYLQMSRKQIRKESGSREIAQMLWKFTVADPYELCFALFYLIDMGDDAPWLLSSGTSLMLYVVKMLPWCPENEDWDDEEWDEWYDSVPFNRHGWMEKDPPPEPVDYLHEKHGGRNLAQVIYGLCRAVVPTGLHPFEEDRMLLIEEGMEEETARKITDTAELLFLSSYQASRYKDFFWNEANDEREEASESLSAIEEEENPQAASAGILKRLLMGQSTVPEEPVSDEQTDQKEELEAEVKVLRKQVKNLKSALALTRQEYDKERARTERDLKDLRMEHRELADLRDLVFNRSVEDPERLEQTEEGFDFPYTVKKRTLVFGGHEAFRKAIRPMFPTVRFMDPDSLTFSPDLIRNADVVWVQSNCISHSQYWSIVKTCRLAGVQMRYFGFASAEKCAEQLVKEDMK